MGNRAPLLRFDRPTLIGIAMMFMVSVIAAVDTILIRMLSPTVHPFVMAFTRAMFGLLVFLPWILARKSVLQSQFAFRHVLRAAIKIGALIAFFYAFGMASLADATAIAFTAPIFVTVGAWLFLAESPRFVRIIAVATGFVGVLIVLQPGQGGGVQLGLMLALVGAVLTAAIQLILKPMTALDSTETLVAWNLIVSVPLAAIPAVLVWVTPSPFEWAMLAVQGAMGVAAMSMITKAFSLAEASLLTPFEFLRLPFVAVLAYVFFAQSVPLTTWIGGIVIFVATFIMARSARRPDIG